MNPDPLLAILARGPVIPVVTLTRAEDAVPLAEALLAGGIDTVEITLRTAAALDGVRALARSGLPILIGAGTCLDGKHLEAAREAGAHFAVSPGSTEALLTAATRIPLPLLPGAATPSEVMRLIEAGYRCLKIFPASELGGPTMLRALSVVFTACHFCPTGGIAAAAAPDYLTLPNVPCVGGSWLTPPALLAAGDFAGITRLAAQ
ncbi:MAG: bifunctional 4-hydroxy-2-oxoglutarate aldolase/2-dehydro-3-deoxy-phosphogluconate aldolase, partial [Gammaproteobacteria bacterium]